KGRTTRPRSKPKPTRMKVDPRAGPIGRSSVGVACTCRYYGATLGRGRELIEPLFTRTQTLCLEFRLRLVRGNRLFERQHAVQGRRRSSIWQRETEDGQGSSRRQAAGEPDHGI